MNMILFVLITINLSLSSARFNRLAGAKLVAPGEYPFIVLTFTVEFRCTASLITDEWVLSAAHCYHTSDNKPIAAKDVLVIAGTNNFLYTSGPYTQERVAKEIHVHPDFKAVLSMNDIALIKVAPFKLSTYVSTLACHALPFPLSTPVQCTAMGWGDIDATTDTTKLHKLSVIAEKSDKACPGLSVSEMSRVICLKQQQGSGLCEGDSGSPLVCSGKIVGIAHEVYTIMSSNETEPPMECGNNDLIMTYMFVCPYLNWIHTYVNTSPVKPSSCNYKEQYNITRIHNIVP